MRLLASRACVLHRLFGITAALALAGRSAGPLEADAQTPAPPAGDDATEARAKAWLARLQKQPPDIDRSQLAPALSQAFDDVTVQAMGRQVQGFGPPKTFEALRTVAMPDGSTGHVYRITWDAGTLDFLFAVDAAGKITAMYFRPD